MEQNTNEEVPEMVEEKEDVNKNNKRKIAELVTGIVIKSNSLL